MTAYLARDNCLVIVGRSWPWCRAFAHRHGVPVIQTGKHSAAAFIPAKPFLEAIASYAGSQAADAGVREPTTLAEARALLGR